MSDLAKIIDDLDALSSQEKGDLVTLLEKTWGVKSSYVPMQVMDDTPPQPVVQQTEFSVVLTGFTSKIDAIKEVRKVMGLDLKSAKDFVEASEIAAKVLKEDLSRADADLLAGQLTASGAKVEIR